MRENEDMGQTILPDRAAEPFREGIRPGALGGRKHFADPHAPHTLPERVAVDRVAIAEEIGRRCVELGPVRAEAPPRPPQHGVGSHDHPAAVYAIYCGRGDMENRLKELHHRLALDQTSGHRFLANQFRVLLSLAAYILFQSLQAQARGTACAGAQVSTLRERLIKLAAWIERSVRRIVVHLPATGGWLSTWQQIARRLAAAPA